MVENNHGLEGKLDSLTRQRDPTQPRGLPRVRLLHLLQVRHPVDIATGAKGGEYIDEERRKALAANIGVSISALCERTKRRRNRARIDEAKLQRP